MRSHNHNCHDLNVSFEHDYIHRDYEAATVLEPNNFRCEL